MLLEKAGFLRLCWLVSLICLAVVVIAGTIWQGLDGAAGAAAGVAVTVSSFSLSVWAVAWAESHDRRLVLPVGLLTYALKFIMLAMVFIIVQRTGWDGIQPLAMGVIVSALAWVTAQAIWTYRAKIPYIDLDAKLRKHYELAARQSRRPAECPK